MGSPFINTNGIRQIMNSSLDNHIAHMHSLLALAAAAKPANGEPSDFVSFAVDSYKNDFKTLEVDSDLTSKIFEFYIFKELRDNRNNADANAYIKALIEFQTEYLHNFEKVKAVFRESFNEKIIIALAAEKVGAA